MPFQPDYPVSSERRAYSLPGGPVGLLVLHGFMGSPISSRPMSTYLNQRGVSVHCPLLPGHGERPDKFHNIPYRRWLAEAEEGLDSLREHCDEIFLLGHSMGSVLGAHLAQKNPDVRGMVMLAPLYKVPSRVIHLTPLLRHFITWLSPWRINRLRPLTRERVLDLYPDLDLEDPAVQAELPKMTRVPLSGIAEMRAVAQMGQKLWPRLTLPAIILQGDHDIAADPEGATEIYERLASEDKTIHIYPGAGHELMRPKDPVHGEVWQEIEGFIRGHSKQPETLTPIQESAS